MLTIWLLLVSFCSFHTGVIAPLSSPEITEVDRFGDAVLSRRTLLKPYLSQYEDFYRGSEGQYKGRSVLNATLKGNIVEKSFHENWMAIGNLASTKNTLSDQLLQLDKTVVYDVYKAVVLLLLHKIQKWTFSHQTVVSIEYYLGLKTETEDIINISMTELFFQQRKNVIKIDDLAQMFYFSCDVGNMIKNDTPSMAETTVRIKFLHFLNKYVGILMESNQTMEEDWLVENVKHNLRLIGDRTDASFGVTVLSMKMMILLQQPAFDEHVQLIQYREGPPLMYNVITYVDIYSKENQGNKINAYHLKILGIVATHVLGYVYNHFELLSKLREYEPDEDDKPVIDCFKPFMSAYMSVFIDRFFEFKGEISQQLVDALFSVMYFLDPTDPQTPDVKNLTEIEKRVLNEHKLPAYLMDDYFVDPKKNDEFDVNMMNLIIYAHQKAVESFALEDTISWNRILANDYDDESAGKEILLQHITANYKNALNTLVIFACEFTIDKQLYEEYGLNVTSS